MPDPEVTSSFGTALVASCETRLNTCRVYGDVQTLQASERRVLGLLADCLRSSHATLLCEPMILGNRGGSPDIVVVDPRVGVHVVEVKGIGLRRVRSVKPGGGVEVSYDAGLQVKYPLKQSQSSMYAIKDAAARQFGGELSIPFECWVVFSEIRRDEWTQKFGEAISSDTRTLFRDDIESADLYTRISAPALNRMNSSGLRQCPPEQIAAVFAAFGDSEVLSPVPRRPNRVTAGSRGETLGESLVKYKTLTPFQLRLASQDWNEGPRLLRGVAGSGKSAVLASQVARLAHRIVSEGCHLFDAPDHAHPRILAVCFNRTLVPFLRARVEASFQQRSGRQLPNGLVTVSHLNKIMWELSQQGLVAYQRVEKGQDSGLVARRYLEDLDQAPVNVAERLGSGWYHAIFVDEGQDFHEDEYRLLTRLCAKSPAGHPRLFVFYDDAQNLYGLARPVWSDLGLEVKGRSVVMDEAYRNTRQILEPAFNVLLGAHAKSGERVQTRTFADAATLEEKRLISWRDGHAVVHFACRDGDPTELFVCPNAAAEADVIAARVRELIQKECLLPEDIAVLALSHDRVKQLRVAIERETGEGTTWSPTTRDEKDQPLFQPDKVTVSTIHAAKGYDVNVVLLASVDKFGDSKEDRATFYVACTRAREWLELFAGTESPFVREVGEAITSTL